MMPQRRRFAGFTLIEMIVTVALVGIIASIATPFLKLHIEREKERELKAALSNIRAAIDSYKRAGDEGLISPSADPPRYPRTLAELVDGVANRRDPKAHKIYFLRRLPRDPMSSSSTATAEETWGKRSYASEPDKPEDGDDVYDVYSLSGKTGTNGIPYREW